jgi:NAD(P)-dependent dehydrogenase (short-subunit alcohol dehydrogenase family)
MEASRENVAVITGASSGIGKEAAKQLLLKGWRVIGIGRNPERCRRAESELAQYSTSPGQFTMLTADLALMSETRAAAEDIAGLTDRVDVLLNNAGGVTAGLQMTTEGNENTFASNHLGHFLLTRCLLPLLQNSAEKSAPGTTRVISVSSLAHQHAQPFDWDDVQSLKDFYAGTAYCQVKLANILFTRELAKRLSTDGIVAHAMHPGVVASNFASHGDAVMQEHMAKAQTIPPEVAADTLVWLASDEEPGKCSGGYFFERKAEAVNPLAEDDEAAARLWQESEKLVAPFLQ